MIRGLDWWLKEVKIPFFGAFSLLPEELCLNLALPKIEPDHRSCSYESSCHCELRRNDVLGINRFIWLVAAQPRCLFVASLFL